MTDTTELKALFLHSIARLPVVERPVAEIVMAGYWRISQTENLIQRTLDSGLCDDGDLEYWRLGLDEECGHADIYKADIVDLFGEDQARKMIADYSPSPFMYWWLNEGIGDCPYTLGIYRTYLEIGLLAMSSEDLEQARLWLPKTMLIHEAADPEHAQKGLEYLAGFTWKNPDAEIERVKRMLTAEIYHIGL